MKHFLIQVGDMISPGGKLNCEVVQSLPVDLASAGRLVLVLDDMNLYYNTTTTWKKTGGYAEIVPSLPSWSPTYEGRLILVTADMYLYYGTDTAWRKAGATTGTVADGRIAVFSGTDGTIKMGSSNAYIDGSGYLFANKVYNAVWNDIADFIDIDPETEIEYGKVYAIDSNENISISSVYCQEGTIGIATDTYGFGLGGGSREIEVKNKLPICIGGFVLAFVDAVYLPGTPLTSGPCGQLTRMEDDEKGEFPERLVGIFFKREKGNIWNGVPVNGRHWIKVI